MSDEEDDAEEVVGIIMPTFGGPVADDDDDEGEEAEAAAAAGSTAAVAEEEQNEEEQEEQSATGLLSAEAAFNDDSIDAIDLDPFRRAAAAEQPEPEEPDEKGKGKSKASSQWVPKGHVSQRKIFIGGLSFDSTEASLLKAISRYGKVQEAVVVRTEGGKSRGFGFATFVSHKGATYILKEAGDPPQITIDGRQCTVRLSEDKRAPTEGLHKLPARGNLPQSKPAPRERRDDRVLPSGGGGGGDDDMNMGISSIAAAHKRSTAYEAEHEPEQSERPKKARKKKEEIVTISRRQDAETLDKRPITMKELFPKEFWRV